MPQLDITAYSTQLFWVFIMLSLIYLVSDLYILPHILRSLRLRNRILDSINKSSKLDITSLQKELQDNLSSFIDVLHKIADHKVLTSKLYDDKKVALINKIDSLLFKHKLAASISAILSLGGKPLSYPNIDNKLMVIVSRKTRTIGVFASLLTPSDEFILMFCFLIFSLGLFFATKSYLADTIDGKIKEIKYRFLIPLELKQANLKAKEELIKALALLIRDKRKFCYNLISDIDKYNRVSDQKFFEIKLHTYFTNKQSAAKATETASIQKILSNYFKNPLFIQTPTKLDKLNLASKAQNLDYLLTEMLEEKSNTI